MSPSDPASLWQSVLLPFEDLSVKSAGAVDHVGALLMLSSRANDRRTGCATLLRRLLRIRTARDVVATTWCRLLLTLDPHLTSLRCAVPCRMSSWYLLSAWSLGGRGGACDPATNDTTGCPSLTCAVIDNMSLHPRMEIAQPWRTNFPNTCLGYAHVRDVWTGTCSESRVLPSRSDPSQGSRPECGSM